MKPKLFSNFLTAQKILYIFHGSYTNFAHFCFTILITILTKTLFENLWKYVYYSKTVMHNGHTREDFNEIRTTLLWWNLIFWLLRQINSRVWLTPSRVTISSENIFVLVCHFFSFFLRNVLHSRMFQTTKYLQYPISLQFDYSPT